MASAQPVERRIALVIGIGAYQTVPQLANPVSDAKSIAATLRSLNFQVDELYDPDGRTLVRGIRNFGLKAQKADVALIYYAGHGIQAAHENYLLPIDTKLERERDLLYEGVPLDLALGEIAQVSKLGIVLLDACRNNPFVARLSRLMPSVQRGEIGSGLARVDSVPRNVIVAMSTRADEVAEDGAGQHSPFAAALLSQFAIPGLELSLFFRNVRDIVLRNTDGRQEPYIFSSVGAEPFYFRPLPPKKPPVVEARRSIRMYTGPIGITAPKDVNGDPLTVIIKTLPRGLIRDGTRTVRAGDRMDPAALAELVYIPEPGFSGNAGIIAYQVDGPGGVAESAVEIEVMDAAEAAAQLAEASLWERVRNSYRAEDFDLFVRVYPNSRFAALAALRRDQLTVVSTAAPPQRPAPRPAAPQPAPSRSQTASLTPPSPPSPLPVPPSTAARPTAPASAPTGREEIALAPPPPYRGFAPPNHDGPLLRDCPTCPVMAKIPGGEFTIGLHATDPAARPLREVGIRPFALGQTPVTVAEWNACQADGGCGPRPRMLDVDDAAPLHDASWDDAQQYVAWLTKVSHHQYRLPSEAEWEYAARAGTTTTYYWSDALGTGHANCSDCGGPRSLRAPAPVQRYAANPFGLYGMAGGVAQWMQDCWFPNYIGLPAGGAPHVAPGCLQHVLRGGSYLAKHDEITPTARNRYDGPVRYPANGFRVARDLEPAE